jgi:cell division protein FtsB
VTCKKIDEQSERIMISRKKFSLAELRRSRSSVLIVLITIVGLWVIHSFWLGPGVLETGPLTAQVEQQKQLIEKYEKKLEQAQGLREKLESQEKELGQLREGLYKGSDPYQLAASLGEVFTPKGSQELNMKSYQVLDSKEYGLYQQVRLKFYFMASIQGLHQFLESLEKTQTVLAVDQMDVRKGGAKGGADLVVNVIISALMEKGESSAKNRT